MKKTTFKRALALTAWMAAIILILVACDDKLDVKQVYSFDLATMPVQKRITEGETVEIRCQIVREGNYSETTFKIRYFQPDGNGELRLDDGTVFLPNDLYPLDRTTFRLYYTSQSTDQQVIDVYIEDSFGQMVQKTFSWQNAKGDDEPEEE
ncbi:DUF3872 domain-containing protein [Anaerorudis cellulosivorans]|jgi:hypothetical protein|uniref:DUF3872 domain-containing protein n=1 Tax=Anaerorudis cellulosivorans TaxID=3397862 RepID=UPI0022208D67|nr:DUF3872 domain-containing protein [Seramator thermalis]MCW1734574.1 DUF3872 domain-containing protein [Seramator thermalis]MDD3963500.1 DUF3872 domain-containing protein [Synergistaceae bacterium]